MKKMKLNIQLFADGKVTIDTDLNNSGFKNGLSKMQSIATTGFKAVASSVGVASVAITGLITKSIKAAGDLEQQIGGTEAVFGNFAKTVQDKAGKAFDQMGVSANDFMATANKMGALMQGSGISIEDSMNLSTQAMQRAADVASIMGIDIGAAMESIAGAAKGNFTMMDNLGVAMNATTIEAYAMSKGINESYASMDNATKIGLAMEMFLEKTTYAEGNYAKENKTFAGSLNTLKAAFSNFLSGAGGIQDVSKALVNFGGILVKSIGEMAPSIVQGITELTQNLIPQIPEIISQLLPVVLEGAISIINSLVEIFPALLQLITDNLPTIVEAGLTILLALVEGIAQSLPQLIPAIVKAVMLIVDTLLRNINLIIDTGIKLIIGLAEGLIEALPILIDNIPIIIDNLINAIIDNLPKILEMGITLIVKLAEGLIKAIPQLVSKIPQIITSLLNGIISYFGKMFSIGGELLGKIKDGIVNGISGMFEIGKNLVQGLWNGINNAKDWVLDKIKGFGNAIVDGIKAIFGIHSPSTLMRDEVGKFLAQGIGVGFDDELDNVYDDMQKAIDLETDKITANVQTSGTYQMAMSGVPEFNLVDNTNNTTQLVVNGRVLAEVVNTENRNREVAKA